MGSNEIEITTYDQETIGDPNGLLIGRTFYGTNIMSGNNKYDVTFSVKTDTVATLLLELDLGLGTPIQVNVNLTYDHYDYVSEIYEFTGEKGEVVTIKLAADGSYVELTYKANVEADYTFGDATGGVILNKVK